MEPLHAIEYELTSEFATNVQETLVPWELRRGWRRDVPLFAGALGIAMLIIWLSLEGWILPGVAGGLIVVVTLFVMGAVYRRIALARGAALTALLALHAPDRHVRIEFTDQRVRLETQFFQGQGAWSELEQVVVFPDYWLLQLSNTGQILIPKASLSAELEAFIRSKAEQVSVPVSQR